MRTRHPRPDLRERAAALVKIAAGQPPRPVAWHGVLVARDPDTVYRWVRRSQAGGVAGLRNRPGRGCTPACSPSAGDAGGGPDGAAAGGAARATPVGTSAAPRDDERAPGQL